MYNGSPRTTAYSEYVFSNLIPIVRDRAGIYNVKELASLVGLKPTNNFRRRVKQLVESGKLQAVPVFTPRGGIEARYHIPEQGFLTEVPF